MSVKKTGSTFTVIEIFVVLAFLAAVVGVSVPFVLNSAKEAKANGLPGEARAIYLASEILIREQAQQGNTISEIKTEGAKKDDPIMNRMKALLGKEISGYASYTVTVENGSITKVVYQKTVAGKDKTTTLEIGKGEEGADLVTVVNTPPKPKKNK